MGELCWESVRGVVDWQGANKCAGMWCMGGSLEGPGQEDRVKPIKLAILYAIPVITEFSHAADCWPREGLNEVITTEP